MATGLINIQFWFDVKQIKAQLTYLELRTMVPRTTRVVGRIKWKGGKCLTSNRRVASRKAHGFRLESGKLKRTRAEEGDVECVPAMSSCKRIN